MKRKAFAILLLALNIVIAGFVTPNTRKGELFAQQTQAQPINNPINVFNYSLPNISFANYKWLPLSVVIKNLTQNNSIYSPQILLVAYMPEEVEIEKEYTISVYAMRIENISTGEIVRIENISIQPNFVEFNKSQWLKICLGIGIDFPTFQKYVHIGVGLFNYWDRWTWHIPIAEGCNISMDYYYRSSFNYTSIMEIPYKEWGEAQIIKFRLKKVGIMDTDLIPIVNFDYFAFYENESLFYQFKSDAIDLDGYIVNYTWNFGEGNISYGKNVSHEFRESGIYNVTLCVTDNDGLTSSISKEIMVITNVSIPNILFVKLNESLLVVACDEEVYWDDILIKVYNATHVYSINLSGEIEVGDEINISEVNLTGNITVSIVWKPTSTIIATYNFIIIPYAKIFVNEYKASKNEDIIVPIWIEGYNAHARYAHIYVSYEPNVISIENISIPFRWDNGWWTSGEWNIIDNHTIEIYGWINGTDDLLNGKYVFAYMTFKVKGDISSFSVIDIQLIDYYGSPYPILKNGLIKILPTLKLIPENAFIPFGSNFTFNLTIDELPNGLAGYNISLDVVTKFYSEWIINTTTNNATDLIEIVNITFPEWATLHTWRYHFSICTIIINTTFCLPPYPYCICHSYYWLKALDLNDLVTQNATNVALATITVKSPTTIPDDTKINGSLNISINRLDDDNGYPIDVVIQDATITVFEALPGFNPPTDPDGDGLYEDINGNGLIDFDDVVEFFWNFEWIEKNWPSAIVDFNGNGLMDYDDIVELFKEV